MPTMDTTGRQEQFERLLEEHGAALARVAALYERRPALREELLQDISVALWQALPGFRGQSSLKTFVLRVATNRSLTHLARRPPAMADIDDAVDLADTAAGPDALADAAARSDRLARGVQSLPLPLRQVVALALEDIDPAGIAMVLGITENNVAVRLHRGKARLRAWMGNSHDR